MVDKDYNLLLNLCSIIRLVTKPVEGERDEELATLGICSVLFLGLAACQQQNTTSEGTNQRQSSSSKEDCYKYLGTKYANYTGDELAKPFIMDNDKWVNL